MLGYIWLLEFPDSSIGKESSCNAGDPDSIPGSGRSAGEGIGYPLQYSWAFVVAQLVKNLPAMQETWVQSLGWEDPLEKGKATYSSILAWRIPWTVYLWGCRELDTTERLSLHLVILAKFTFSHQRQLEKSFRSMKYLLVPQCKTLCEIV